MASKRRLYVPPPNPLSYLIKKPLTEVRYIAVSSPRDRFLRISLYNTLRLGEALWLVFQLT